MKAHWIRTFFVLCALSVCAHSHQQIAQVDLISGVPSGTIVLSEQKEARIGYTDTGLVTTVHTGIETWSTKSTMPTGRQGLAVAVVEGKIYAMGGHDNVLPYSAACEEYDPQADSWVIKTPMPTPREAPAAAAVGGKVYVIGGYDGSNLLSTVEQYDPTTDTWTAKAFMPTPRSGHRAVAVGDKIYVIAGFSGSGSSGAVEEYDPQSNTWSVKGDMPFTWVNTPAAAVYNGKVYVAGGWTGGFETSQFSVYDPSTDSWQAAPNLGFGVQGASAGFLGDRFIQVGGLYNSSIGSWTQEFDFRTKTWWTRANSGYARYYGDAAVVGGKLYYIGGFDTTNSVTGSNQVYDPGYCTLYLHKKN